MKNKIVIAVMLLTTALCTTSSARAEGGPSFDCRYAKTPDEIAICHNPSLADDDRRMSSAYFHLRRLAIQEGRTDNLKFRVALSAGG